MICLPSQEQQVKSCCAKWNLLESRAGGEPNKNFKSFAPHHEDHEDREADFGTRGEGRAKP